MRTITPFELQMLIDKRDVELIDVRPKKDFEKIHASVARSIPLSNFEPHSVLAHRKLDRHAPLYIMCRRKTLASLAACGLTGAGLAEAIVVEGGLEAWEEQCLPVVRKKSWPMSALDAPTSIMLAGLGALLLLVFHRLLFFAALSFFSVGAVFYALGSARQRNRAVETNHWRGARAGEFPQEMRSAV